MADFNPSAPAFLPGDIAKKWLDAAKKEYARLSTSDPNSDSSALQVAALKKANELLAISAPQSAADIQNLADWQCLQRGTRTNAGGVEEAFVVTIDGQKFVFPVGKK